MSERRAGLPGLRSTHLLLPADCACQHPSLQLSLLLPTTAAASGDERQHDQSSESAAAYLVRDLDTQPFINNARRWPMELGGGLIPAGHLRGAALAPGPALQAQVPSRVPDTSLPIPNAALQPYNLHGEPTAALLVQQRAHTAEAAIVGCLWCCHAANGLGLWRQGWGHSPWTRRA